MKWCAPLDDGLVVIGLYDDHIICAWITIAKKNSIVVRALTQYSMPYTGTDYAPVFLQQKIDCFLKANKLVHPLLVFCLADSWLPLSCCVAIDVATPTKDMFLEYTSPFLWWNNKYLYPTDDRHTFYIYGTRFSALFSIQLCAIKLHAPLVAIIPQQLALLYTYSMMRPGLSATAQFFEECIGPKSATAFFSKQDIHRFVRIDTKINQELVSDGLLAWLYGVWIAQQY